MSNNIIEEKGKSKGSIGYTPDDYKQALGQVPYSTSTGDTTKDYYNALKNESYKALLNSEVQASIARDQALKYTNNSLRAKGYGNQGLAESTNLGLHSQYQTALANAASNYQENIKGINEQERTAQNDNFQSMATLMGGATDSNQLNDIIKTYGYGELNDDGTMAWNEKAMANLDENSKKQLQILYNMYNAQLNQSQTPTFNSLEALNSGTYVGKDGKVHQFKDHYVEEMKYLWHIGSNGQLTKGDSIEVKNGNGDTAYLEWLGNGFRVIEKPAKATHKLTWNQKSKTLSYE